MSRGIWWYMGARTRRSLTLFWAALFVFSLLLQYATFAAPASVDAVHTTGTFQLEGNVVDDGAGDDWENVAAGTDSAFESIFETDPINGVAAERLFTGGDSKDIDDIPDWLWTSGPGVQDKNDLENVFAAAYIVDGDLVVYFGADRYAANGDAQLGFWFLQDDIGMNADGTFSGEHQDGDVLVQIDFQNGGASPILRVYEWVGSGGDTSGTLDLVATGGSCASTPAGDLRCAIANTTVLNPPYAFDEKFEGNQPNDSYVAGSLIEGGINLTDLGLAEGCFTTFVAETRSSQEPTSTLSDFLLGSFDLCGEVTIVKNAVPDDAQDFAYSGDFGNFSLDDDGNATLPNSITFENVNPGSYDVTEASVNGWRLTNLVCVESGNSNSTVNLGTRTATINVETKEDVTCTFTNTKDGKIITVKETDPDGATQSFEFDPSWGPNFNLTDGQSNDSGFLTPGSGYSVVENTPAGWDLSNVSCSDGSANTNINLAPGETVTCTFTNRQEGKIIVVKQTTPDGSTQSFEFDTNYGANFNLTDGQSNDSGLLDPGTYSVAEIVPAGWELTGATCSDGSNPSSINLGAGETVTCTFNNRQQGKIIVTKQTVPDGASQSFHFDADYDADGFNLTDGQSNDSGFLSTGTYAVSEDVPTGWDLTSATCSDGSAPGSIALAPGETVTCTFTNTQRGQIIVTKQTDPDGDPTLFTFAASYDADGFQLSDGQSNNSGLLQPGIYTVTETVPAGWDLTSATCDDGSAPAAINLAAGETVTCTFNNQKDANIVVVKQTLPDGSTQSFEFDPSWGPNFNLTDGQSNDSGDLDPGTYSVSEIVPSGWDLTSATCSDGSAPGSIGLAAGETVTCTFTNTQRGTIIVEKQTSPDGASGDFDFTGDAAGTISDGETIVVSNLVPGTYTSTEADPTPDFDLGAIVCDDGSSANASSGNVETRTATFELDPGETVKCVFTNSQRGTITIIKNAQPDSAQDFAYTTTGSGLSGFSLDDDDNATLSDTKTFTNLVAGDYSVTELAVAGWDLTSLECNGTNGSTGVADGATADITLTDGGSVTCVYVNSLPSISIVKTAGDAADGGELVVEAGTDVTFTYVVTNTGPVTLVDITVVDDNGTADTGDDFTADCQKTTLAAGESMDCTATVTVNETRTNVAVASGESEQGTEVDDEDDAVVRVPGTDLTKENDDEDGIVGHGQVVGYTINVTIFEGPVTNATVTDELPVGQTYVPGSQSTNPVADSFSVSLDGRTLTWVWDELDSDAVITYDVTIDADAPTGPQTNVAELCVTELETCQPDDSTVTVPELTIDKSFTGNTGGTGPGGIQEAKIGDTLTYTLAYDLTNGPVTNGVITDVIPVGLQYVTGSATNNAEFTFQSYNAATRTLTWTADEVTVDGSVTYQVKVLVGADELPQPLINVASIDSDETDKDDDEDDVFVEPPPQIATATPRITLPPTSTLDGADRGTNNPGQTLMLVLLGLAGLVLAVGFVTPVPERARRRGRRR